MAVRFDSSLSSVPPSLIIAPVLQPSSPTVHSTVEAHIAFSQFGVSMTAEKRGRSSSCTGGNRKRRKEDDYAVVGESSHCPNSKRRILRSQYLAVKQDLSDGRDDLLMADSEKFNSIIEKMENLHKQVERPLEQVADAETLLHIVGTLVSSVKSQSIDGITPADLVSSLLEEYAETTIQNEQLSFRWRDLGLAVSSTFRTFYGCQAMVGLMNIEPKQRKVPVRRSGTTKGLTAHPEELDHPGGAQEKTCTDRTMEVLFDILIRRSRVRLEYLILNRKFFAKTVENVFALSFLVKDGRAEITIDDNGIAFVSPRNAAPAGTLQYLHYIFRFNFNDWKVMADIVPCGEELMLQTTS